MTIQPECTTWPALAKWITVAGDDNIVASDCQRQAQMLMNARGFLSMLTALTWSMTWLTCMMQLTICGGINLRMYWFLLITQCWPVTVDQRLLTKDCLVDQKLLTTRRTTRPDPITCYSCCCCSRRFSSCLWSSVCYSMQQCTKNVRMNLLSVLGQKQKCLLHSQQYLRLP